MSRRMRRWLAAALVALPGAGGCTSPSQVLGPARYAPAAAATPTPLPAGQAAGAPAPPAGVAGAVAAVGRRVDGIPAFVALPPGATLTGSAVQPDGDLLRVSLTASTRALAADVLGFYRRTLAAAGFSATDDGLLPAGSTGAAYGRGRQLLVVAVVDRGQTRSFSVGGSVAAPPRQRTDRG